MWVQTKQMAMRQSDTTPRQPSAPRPQPPNAQPPRQLAGGGWGAELIHIHFLVLPLSLSLSKKSFQHCEAVPCMHPMPFPRPGPAVSPILQQGLALTPGLEQAQLITFLLRLQDFLQNEERSGLFRGLV